MIDYIVVERMTQDLGFDATFPCCDTSLPSPVKTRTGSRRESHDNLSIPLHSPLLTA